MKCFFHVVLTCIINQVETIYTCFWAVNTAFIKFIYCSVLSSEPLITYQKKYWIFVQTYSWYNSKYHMKLSNNSKIYSRFINSENLPKSDLKEFLIVHEISLLCWYLLLCQESCVQHAKILMKRSIPNTYYLKCFFLINAIGVL